MNSSTDDQPGAIWLLLGLVEMSEAEEETSQEHRITAIGLLHCEASDSEDSKLYGWLEGSDFSTDVSKTHKKEESTPPPPPHTHTPLTGQWIQPKLIQAAQHGCQ